MSGMSGEDISFLLIGTSGVIILVCIIFVNCCLKIRKKCMNHFQHQNSERELIARTSTALEHFMFMDHGTTNSATGQQSRGSRNDNNNRSLVLDPSIDPVSFRRLATLAASVSDPNFQYNDNNSIRAAPPGINQLWWALLLDSSFQFMDSIFFADTAIERQQRPEQLSYKHKLTKEQQKEYLCGVILKDERVSKTQSTPVTSDDELKLSSSPTTTCEKNCSFVSSKSNEDLSNDEAKTNISSNQSNDQIQNKTNCDNNDDTITDNVESDKSVSQERRSSLCCKNSVINDCVFEKSSDDEQSENSFINCPICLDDIGK